jgi:hypothetical protein
MEAGGGVIIGVQAWYWAYSKPIAQHPNNKLTATLGFVLTGDAFDSPYTFVVGEPPSQTSNADVALNCLADSCLGKSSSSCYTDDTKKLAGIMQGLTRAAEFAPATSAFMKKLATVSDKAIDCEVVC